MKRLECKNSLAELDKLRAFLTEFLDKLSLSEASSYWIELSFVEMCINVIRYAYPDAEGKFSVKIWMDKDSVYIEIRDKGIPFNPWKVKSPVLENIIKIGKKGGYGIFLARQLMDGFQYSRKGGENILILSKNISVSGA